MNVSDYNRILDVIRGLPKPRIYRNSTPIATIDNVPILVWDGLCAATYRNLNTLIVGERGDGKTQLANELRSGLFDGKATYIRMRDSLRAQDIYETFDLAKLRGAKGAVVDARQSTGAVQNGLTVLDEVNRAHEKVQNQVYGICDGYVELSGARGPQKVPLGIDLGDGTSLHVVVGTANLDDTRYSGTSRFDPALLDRFHLIVNTDDHPPTALDLAVIGMDSHGPKIVDALDEDHTAELVDIVKTLNSMSFSLDARVTQLYLEKRFSYCERTDTKNKRSVLSALPRMCEGCHLLADGCGYTHPLSTRSFKAIGTLAQGLKAVVDAKNGFVAKDSNETRPVYDHMLAAFELVTVYGGMFNSTWLDQQYQGNPHTAMRDVTKQLQKEIAEKRDPIGAALGEAIAGKLTEKSMKPFEKRWLFFRSILESFNEAAQKYGDLTSADLARVGKEYPLVGWLS